MIARNVIAENPVAVDCSAISGEGDAVGAPLMENNWFWNNDQVMEKMRKAEPIPAGSSNGDPDFVNSDKHDYSLSLDSPARQAGMGAAEIVSVDSNWPVQTEETAMIPSTDTRDYREWKKPPAIR